MIRVAASCACGDAAPPAVCCFVAGHSHIASFGLPLNPGTASAVGELPHASGRFRIVRGEWPRTKAYWREVANAAAGNLVALFWRGNQHVSSYLLEADPHFDFVLSSEPDLSLDETATIVPEAIVRASFLPTLQGLTHLLRFLQAVGAEPVVCGTPPPCGNDMWIVKDYLTTDPRWIRLQVGRPWPRQFNRDGSIDPDAIRLTSRVLRYKVWAVLHALECETAAAAGAAFLPPPQAARTADGFLRDEYRRDITHGNDAYGGLVLEGLWQRMQANIIAAV